MRSGSSRRNSELDGQSQYACFLEPRCWGPSVTQSLGTEFVQDTVWRVSEDSGLRARSQGRFQSRCSGNMPLPSEAKRKLVQMKLHPHPKGHLYETVMFPGPEGPALAASACLPSTAKPCIGLYLLGFLPVSASPESHTCGLGRSFQPSLLPVDLSRP